MIKMKATLLFGILFFILACKTVEVTSDVKERSFYIAIPNNAVNIGNLMSVCSQLPVMRTDVVNQVSAEFGSNEIFAAYTMPIIVIELVVAGNNEDEIDEAEKTLKQIPQVKLVRQDWK